MFFSMLSVLTAAAVCGRELRR